MEVKKFIRMLPEQWETFAHPAVPKDKKLRYITETQDGMATENVGFLLNFAVSLLDPGECYLEIGTWKGRTLSYAMEGNEDKEFYACDNFSQFARSPRWYWPFGEAEPKRSLLRLLRKATKKHRVTFFEGEFRDNLVRFVKTIGVYFYDGAHTLKDQLDGLELAFPHMAPVSVIIVDDTNPYEKSANESEAREANRLWLLEHRDWQLLFDLRAPLPPRHAGWGNGVQVLGRFRS